MSGAAEAADPPEPVVRTFADAATACALCDTVVVEDEPVVEIRGEDETLVVCMLCALESADEQLVAAARS